jgi:hypothetical protein
MGYVGERGRGEMRMRRNGSEGWGVSKVSVWGGLGKGIGGDNGWGDEDVIESVGWLVGLWGR